MPARSAGATGPTVTEQPIPIAPGGTGPASTASATAAADGSTGATHAAHPPGTAGPTRTAVAGNPATRPAGTAYPAHPAMPAGTARRGSAGRAYPTRTALPPGPTGTAVAPQPGSSAHATGATVTTGRHGGHPCPAGAAYAANAPVAVKPAAMPAGATGPTRSAVAGIKAGSTGPAVTDQAGIPAVTTRGVCRGAGPAGSAVTPQKPTGRAVLSRRPIGTVADERSAQQCLGGRVDGREQLLLDGLKRGYIGRLGECIRTVCGAQCLGELPVKLRHLSADRLILQGSGVVD